MIWLVKFFFWSPGRVYTLYHCIIMFVPQDDKENSQSTSNHETRSTDIKTLSNLLVELALHEHVRLRTQKLDSTERLDENSRLLKANLHRFPR